MLRIVYIVAVAFTALTWAGVANAFIWSPSGHRVIASICYRRMEPKLRSAVADLLREHPRYDEDFRQDMPREIQHGDREQQDEWLFQQAAAWPDVVRNGPDARTRFHRPTWHYINVPHYLTPADRAVFEGHTDTNLNMQPPDNLDEMKMNIVQAIKANSIVLRSDKPAATKAVCICWLLHCVGDVHQPHHTTALFSRRLFPEGDRGANRIKTNELDNLHAVWDRSLGGSSFLDHRNASIEYLADDRYDVVIEESLKNFTLEQWLKETFEIAKEHAYNREIVEQLKDREANGGDLEKNPIMVSENYLRNRRVVADSQIVAAGVRMAKLFETLAEPDKKKKKRNER